MATLHILILLSFYQYTYVAAKRFISYERFSVKSQEESLNFINIDASTMLVFMEKDKNKIKRAYYIKKNKICYFCTNLILNGTNGIGYEVSEFLSSPGSSIKLHTQLTFNNINSNLFKKQPIFTQDQIDKSFTDTVKTLVVASKTPIKNRAILQKELIQKILLLISPLFILPLILTHFKKENSSIISGFFLGSSLFFGTLFLSKTYTLLLKNQLINGINSFFYLLITISISFLMKIFTKQRQKKRNLRNNHA